MGRPAREESGLRARRHHCAEIVGEAPTRGNRRESRGPAGVGVGKTASPSREGPHRYGTGVLVLADESCSVGVITCHVTQCEAV